MSSTLSKNLLLSPKKHSQCLDLMVHNAKHVLWVPNNLHPNQSTNQPTLRECSNMYPQPLDVLLAEVKHAESNLSEVSLYPPPSLTPVMRAGPHSQAAADGLGWLIELPFPTFPPPRSLRYCCHCSLGGFNCLWNHFWTMIVYCLMS